MTKSRKRREHELAKEQAVLLASAPTISPRDAWSVSEGKNITWIPMERDPGKTAYSSERCTATKDYHGNEFKQQGRSITHRIPGTPGPIETVIQRIGFPCSRVIMQHTSGALVKLTYSKTTGKCNEPCHQPDKTRTACHACPRCHGTKVADSTSFSATPVILNPQTGRYLPLGTPKRMGIATFTRYAAERFGRPGLPVMLESLSLDD